MKTLAGRWVGPRKPSTALAALIVAALLPLAGNVSGEPRPPLPPWPEIGISCRQRFDQPLSWLTNAIIDPSVWVESWTGYALNREAGTVVAPWVEPMLGPNGAYRIDAGRGALRFWYMPTYDTTLGLSGPACLMTLVSTNGASSLTWWSLVFAPGPEGGTLLELLCPTEAGTRVWLSAPVTLQTGAWALFTLGYTETNSVLWANDQPIALGDGLATVPAEVAPLTSLVLGSDLSGQSPAAGQIEEVTAFSGRNRFRQITGYEFGLSPEWDIQKFYDCLAPVAALGPITPQEEAARQQGEAQRMTANQASLLGSPMGNAPGEWPAPDPSWCGTNDICNVWLTNIVVWPDAESGWNIALTIGGGTNGALYDVFCTTGLLGGSLTNMPWVWVTNAYACDTIVLPYQPDSGAFYILGTPLDSDGDGLTDAYELLVSHTDPLTADNPYLDSNGNGVPDWLELLMGYDPHQANDLGKSQPGYDLFLAQPRSNTQLP